MTKITTHKPFKIVTCSSRIAFARFNSLFRINSLTSEYFWFLNGFWRSFLTYLVTGHSAFAYRQPHPSPTRGGRRHSFKFWKIDVANSGTSTTRQCGCLLHVSIDCWEICGADSRDTKKDIRVIPLLTCSKDIFKHIKMAASIASSTFTYFSIITRYLRKPTA